MLYETTRPRNKTYGECCYCANQLNKGAHGDRFNVKVYFFGDSRYCDENCRSLDNPHIAEKQDEEVQLGLFNGAPPDYGGRRS